MVRTRGGSGPRLALIRASVFFVPESRDPDEGGPDPTQRGPGPVPGVRSVPAGVLDPAWRSGPDMQGYDTFPWGSGPTVDTLEDIVFPATWRPGSRPRGGVMCCSPRD
jgi:hypothetical protein